MSAGAYGRDSRSPRVVVVGGGPAGLMAAEVLQAAGLQVHLYDAMPSVGRKFLLAGKGGLNLTHSEPLEPFVSRYGARSTAVARWLQVFGPDALRAWAAGLGVQTFVGSSGRVFPKEMKAAPLLRAWLHRLRHPARGQPVQFHMRHRWVGWSGEGGRWQLDFDAPGGRVAAPADAVVLALGGASWPRLGSDAAWVPLLQEAGVEVAPLQPANCGFDVHGGWSPHFAQQFAGAPLKSVAIRVPGDGGGDFVRKGEFVATATGIEGSLVYAAAHLLRDAIRAHGEALLHVDLLPAWEPERVLREVARPRGSRSLSSHLKGRLGLAGIKAALLHECLSREQVRDPATLARGIKQLPLRLAAARPVAEAISTAGGVRLEALSPQLLCRALPGVACAGEMLDWEAPTGGYLLTAAMASGRVAADGVRAWLQI